MTDEKKYKLKDGVISCPSKVGMIEDHEPRPANEWGDEDEVLERVKDGYLVEVKSKKPEPAKT